MSLTERVGQKIAIQRRCLLTFPCKRCEEDDAFDGAGCRILATAALAGMIPSAHENFDDDQRAEKVARELHNVTAEQVVEIVEKWFDEVLTEFE